MNTQPRIIIIRIGADTGQLGGGFLGPLFEDGSFDLICIPEYEYQGIIEEPRNYSNCQGNASNKQWIEYVTNRLKQKLVSQMVHFDPEFETFTYGDPGRTRKKLGELQPGDFVVFYAGLESKEGLRACYIVGYFEISLSISVDQTNGVRANFLNEFSNNFHVMHEKVFQNDIKKKLKLIKGSKNSKLLKKAYRISDYLYKGHYYLSEDMKKIFGPLGEKSDLLRSTPREVQKEFVLNVIKWLESLS